MGVCRRSRTLSLDRLSKVNSQIDGGDGAFGSATRTGHQGLDSALPRLFRLSLAMFTISSYNEIRTQARSST
jgi:hypothetical protein